MKKSGDTGEGGVGGKRADLAGLKLFQLALEAHWPIPGNLVQANEAELRKILTDPEAGRRSKLAAMRVLESMRRANLASIETAIRAEERDSQAAERAELVEQHERERINDEQSIAEDSAIVQSLMGEGLSLDRARDFVADLHEAGAKERNKDWTITDELRSRVLGWPVRPRVSAARKDAIVHELLCRYGLAEPDEPEPIALPSPVALSPVPVSELEPSPAPQPAPDRPPPPMIRPRLEPPIEPDPSPLPVKPGVWVDMGGEFFISIPEEP